MALISDVEYEVVEEVNSALATEQEFEEPASFEPVQFLLDNLDTVQFLGYSLVKMQMYSASVDNSVIGRAHV